MLSSFWLIVTTTFFPALVQAPADTVVAVQAYPGGAAGVFAIIRDIATIIIALALLATVVALAAIALIAKKLVGKVGGLLDKVQDGVDPVLKHARDVGDNVNYVTTAIRVDVQQLNKTIANANQRVNEVVVVAEERINELNGLIKVVQEEAEDIFIDTASTVRGIRAGADALRRPRPPATPDRGHINHESGRL